MWKPTWSYSVRFINIVTIAFISLFLYTQFTTEALAAEANISVDVPSGYVWRGMTFNEGAVIQPSVDACTAFGFGVNVWGNFDLDDYDGAYEKCEFSARNP